MSTQKSPKYTIVEHKVRPYRIPDYLVERAGRIRELVVRPGGLKHFQASVVRVVERHLEQERALARWNAGRATQGRDIALTPKLRKRSAKPPGEGWEFHQRVHVYSSHDDPGRICAVKIRGWTPPDLLAHKKPGSPADLFWPTGQLGLSTSAVYECPLYKLDERPFEPDQQLTVLGLIHDAVHKTVEQVNPFSGDVPKERSAAFRFLARRYRYERWLNEAARLIADNMTEIDAMIADAEAGRTEKNAEKGAPKPESKRRWTQAEVDTEIRKLMETHRRKLAQLGKGVTQQKPGAVRAWREFFGRNTLVKKLRCPPAMVSNSSPWKVLAGELGLAGRRPGVGRGERIGLEKAEEQAGLARHRELKRLEAEQAADAAADERPRGESAWS